MTAHPFRFAVITAQAGSGEEWVERARRTEALGYSTLVMPDTLGPTLSPVPALGVVAGATRTLRLGTYVLVDDPLVARSGAEGGQLLRSGSPGVLTGAPEQMAEQLQRTRERLGISYFTLWDGLVEAMAPVVELLAGR